MQYKALLRVIAARSFFAWAGVSMLGCSELNLESMTVGSAAATKPKILARVGDWQVTAEELSQVSQDILGGNAANPLFVGSEDKLLHSLIVSKAMAQQALSELSESELQTLDFRVSAFREQWLVQQYLKNHAGLSPPTRAEVKAFYEQNLERFGADKRYHYIKFSVKPDTAAARVQASEQLTQLDQADVTTQTPSQLQARFKASGLELVSSEVASNLSVVSDQLRSVLTSTQTQQLSALHLDQEGTFYRLYIKSIETIAPKSLEEVTADIRRMLAPVQLRSAIQRASDQALAEIGVEYFSDSVDE